MTRTLLVDARLPWGSGIGRYVRNIVPPVAARLPAVAVTLLVTPDDAARARAAVEGLTNVRVEETAITPFSLAEQTSLPAVARHHDLTWFTNYWVPLRWPGRFVATVHDLMHLDPRFPAAAIKRFAAARTFAKLRRDAAHVIFVSRFTARTFETELGSPAAASVVHHGIDHAGVSSPAPSSPQGRQRFGLVVAAAKEHKNLALLLDAWAEATLADWQLTVVTPDDRLRSSIDLDARAARVPGVRVLRGIGDRDLAALYARAGFAMVPSRYEGFGLPLLEAMRAGAPVISSTAEALVEVAAGALIPFVSPDDRDGWVDAIRDMAARCGPSDAWEAALCRHNAALAGAFTWSAAADRTATILQRALDGG